MGEWLYCQIGWRPQPSTKEAAVSRFTPAKIIATLEEAGYCALYVGGYVRDRILGLDPEDADLATSASAEQVVELFRGTANVNVQGKHFGVVVVDGTEVAMFRGESYTIPGKPDVFLARDFTQDAARRDFTINALGMNSAGQIIDPVGGVADLRAGLIRAVGDAGTRFGEDPARLLRAVTFASRLGFVIEERTADAVKSNAHLLASLPVERMAKELAKMLDRRVLHRGLVLMKELELLQYVLPGWPADADRGRNEAWLAVVATVEKAESGGAFRAVVLAAMATAWASEGHHVNDCAEQARAMVLRLGFGRALAKRVASLVGLSIQPGKLGCDPRLVLGWLRQVSSVCRNVSEMKALVEELWQIQQAKQEAVGGMPPTVEEVPLRRLVDAMLDGVPWYPADADIDVCALGLKGPELGRRILDLLERAQVEAVARLENERS